MNLTWQLVQNKRPLVLPYKAAFKFFMSRRREQDDSSHKKTTCTQGESMCFYLWNDGIQAASKHGHVLFYNFFKKIETQ